MKKIMTILAVAAAMLFAGNANAQLGLHAGFSPESWTEGDNSTDLNSIFVGAHYNMPLAADLKIGIGGQLRYSFESSESSFYGIAAGKHSTSLLALEVPVMLNYGFNLTSDLRFTLFGGPKLSYYLMGSTKYEGSLLGLGADYEEKWFDEEGFIQNKAFNFSLSFGIALSYNQFSLFGGYNMGMSDRDNNDNTTTKTSGLFFGLGMML